MKTFKVLACLLVFLPFCMGQNFSPNSVNGANGSVVYQDSNGNTTTNSNVSNTNTNNIRGNVQGGQGGSAFAQGGRSSSKSSSKSNSSGSNNTTFAASSIPAASAFALSPPPTVPCFKGYGAAGQGGFGLSFSGGKVDENCAILETARSFALHGNDLAYCKVMLTDKYAKQAGVTLSDCLAAVQTAEITPTVTLPTPVASIEPIEPIEPAIEPVIEPVPDSLELSAPTTMKTLASCTNTSSVDNVCKAQLDTAVLFLKQNQGTVTVQGNQLTGKTRADSMKRYLLANGIDESRVVFALGDEDTTTLSLVYANQ